MKTILLDDDRWKTLLRHCREEKYVPLICVITGSDLDAFDRPRGKAGGRGRTERNAGSRRISRFDSKEVLTSPAPVNPDKTSSTSTPPPVQDVQTVRPTLPPHTISRDDSTEGDTPNPTLAADDNQPEQPLLTRQPLPDDRFSSRDEALRALREISVLMGQGLGLPMGRYLGPPLVLNDAHVDPPMVNAVQSAYLDVRAQSPSPLGNIIVEVVEDVAITETRDKDTILPTQERSSLKSVDEEMPFSAIATVGFLDEI